LKRWQRIKGAVRIELYFDEYGIVNPIGPSRSEHKYLSGYASVANVPLRNRMKRDDLSLILIANHKGITDETYEQILDPVYQQLEELCKNGIQVYNETTAQFISILCVLSAIVADNLEHHQLVGGSKSFGAVYICRWCAATSDEI